MTHPRHTADGEPRIAVARFVASALQLRDPAPMDAKRLHQLFLLNLCLQVFDGVATYQGLQHHWGEGNPILVSWMPYLGAGGTLLLFKAKACGFLVLLRRLAGEPLVYEAFVVLATVYTFFSFIPWLTRIISLLQA